MFSGGALSRLTIFALGIMPYISSSIIIQLMTIVSPYLARLKKEGEQGQKKITQYTRYGTVLLSTIQGSGIAVGLEAMKSPSGGLIVPEPGWSFRMMTVLTLTAGTCFLMWLGEQITERGIGNGISLIIFSGIVAGTPAAIFQSMDLMGTGEMSVLVMLFLLVLMVVVVGVIVFTEGGQRRIPIQYAKRVVGRKMMGGQSTHLPLKVNTSGVIPPIFASSIIMFPATIAQFIPSLEYSKSDVILEVGSGVGYCTAILESLSSIVVGVEADKDLRDKANKVIGQIGLESAIIIDGLHNKGHLKSAPYDKIFIFGSIPKVPDEIFKQLAENGNLVSAIKNKDATNSKVIVFTKNKGIISSSILLETFIPAIPGFDESIDFEF